MAEPTIQLGGGNWAGKTDNLLGYYKEGERFYKQDFTFSRSTTGTYTDSDGYIQEMPYNLVTYSEDYTQWTLVNGTLYANSTISPDGTLNASKVVFSSNVVDLKRTITVTANTTYTYSFYIKLKSGTGLQGRFYDNSNSANIEYYTYSSQITGSDWTRVTREITTPSGCTEMQIWLLASSSSLVTASFWGAQLVKGSSAKTYFPTTTRLNMPRVSYLNNSNGSLILEPQRSNLVTYSSDFSQWSISTEDTSTMTITPNYATAQNGLSASRLVATRPSTNFLSLIANYVTNSNTATKSVYIKNNNAGNVDINISDQAITVTDTWQRYEITNNYPHATIGLRYAGAALSCDISIAGFQFELGSYATSYIPTSGSSVTRNADACSITNVADRIGQTEGTLFGEIAALTEVGDGTTRLSISDGTQDNNVTIGYSATNTLRAIIRSGASNQALMTSSQTITNYLKVAVKYKANDFALWVNGVEVATDTSGLAPVGLSELAFDRGDRALDFYGKCKDLKVYNTALSDSELATLTTL